jgi:hypothetical protein
MKNIRISITLYITYLFLLTALFLFSSLAANALADDKSDKGAPKHDHNVKHDHHIPPDTSSAELNRIKALAGRWKSTTSMFGKENEEVFTEYKVTAAGAAVIETIFPGTPNEMVSVYYDDDNGKLSMTHYCMLRNRPHFTLVKSTKDEIKLDVTKVEGLKSKEDPSMGAVTLKFSDKNNFSTTCEGQGKANEAQPPMTMHYTRVE